MPTIKEIAYNGIRPPADAIQLKSYPGLSWSRSILLSVPVRLFGKLITSIQISSWGAIRASGKYSSADATLPASLYECEDGCLLVPFGNLFRIEVCGAHLLMFVAGQKLIFDFDVKNRLNLDQRYQFQVQIDLKTGIVEYHYYGCYSNFQTLIGVVGHDTKDVLFWDQLKPGQLYARKALQVNTSPNAEPVDPTEPIKPPSPFDPSPTPTPAPEPAPEPPEEDAEWQVVHEGSGYQVREWRVKK